jgi:hypothetical protein
MCFKTSRSRLLFLTPLILVSFSACQTMIWTPASTISTVRENIETAPADGASKQFVTKSAWRDGDWVMKKGATIAFRSDGFGSFSGRLYTVRPARKQEFHFQSVQYGRDGKLLFSAPAADLGYAIHARNAEQDYPVDFNFGYDRRHFEFIERALFTARIRMPADSRTRSRSQITRSSSAITLEDGK